MCICGLDVCLMCVDDCVFDVSLMCVLRVFEVCLMCLLCSWWLCLMCVWGMFDVCLMWLRLSVFDVFDVFDVRLVFFPKLEKFSIMFGKMHSLQDYKHLSGLTCLKSFKLTLSSSAANADLLSLLTALPKKTLTCLDLGDSNKRPTVSDLCVGEFIRFTNLTSLGTGRFGRADISVSQTQQTHIKHVNTHQTQSSRTQQTHQTNFKHT